MQSPFDDVLYTNTVPSDTECNSIRSLLAGPLKDLADVEEKMRHLQSLMDEAAQKREKLRQFIDAHLALLSPVRRLPDDIVRTVFTSTLPTSRNPTIGSDEAPLLLCRVCKSWRTVALTTPRLWASMHIVVPPLSKFEPLVALVNTWLARSGSVPLDISMVYSRACDPDIDVSPLLSTLATESRRWRQIHLMFPRLAAHSLGRLLSDDVPRLQSIGLCLPPPMTEEDLNGSWPFTFLATNSLRNVTFTGTHSFVDTVISWGTLTHLDISDTFTLAPSLTCARALAILSQCTMLQKCKLALQDTAEEPPPIQHFSLPHLSTFLLLNNSNQGISHRFFRHLSLPNLRSFYLDSAYMVDLRKVIPSVTLMERLHLDVEGLGCENLLAALADMPLLQELALSAEPRSKEQVEEPNIWRHWKSVEGDKDFLGHLTPNGRGPAPSLCPLLRRVDFHLGLVSDEALLKFVQYRTGGGGTLSSVTATFHRPVQFDIIPHLRDTIASGLVVALKYDEGPKLPTYSPLEGNTNPPVYMLRVEEDDPHIGWMD
ncbi:hypothetical protein B0H14DRAFT_2439675 [Mycena olivaceomarginata]|nr:hypothetical protein B0H14DRAFT_2439675 [Mycena olivaceomarginata]